MRLLSSAGRTALVSLLIISFILVQAQDPSHKVILENRCGVGSPTLVQPPGHILATGLETFTDARVNAVAFLNMGFCGPNGGNCTVVAINLGENDGTSRANIDLIPPREFSTPVSFMFRGACDGAGTTCLTPDCPNAARDQEQMTGSVVCAAPQTELLVTFCPELNGGSEENNTNGNVAIANNETSNMNSQVTNTNNEASNTISEVANTDAEAKDPNTETSDTGNEATNANPGISDTDSESTSTSEARVTKTKDEATATSTRATETTSQTPSIDTGIMGDPKLVQHNFNVSPQSSEPPSKPPAALPAPAIAGIVIGCLAFLVLLILLVWLLRRRRRLLNERCPSPFLPSPHFGAGVTTNVPPRPGVSEKRAQRRYGVQRAAGEAEGSTSAARGLVSDAQPVPHDEHPELDRIVEGLASRFGWSQAGVHGSQQETDRAGKAGERGDEGLPPYHDSLHLNE